MIDQHPEYDTLLAGGLIASPAWSVWLSNVNVVLTSVTLIVGLILGGCRLWAHFKGADGDASGE